MDRHDVEAAGAVGEPVPRHVVERELRHPPALERRHRLGRLAERPALPRLHLDEHQRLAVARDDVQFATAAAVAPGKNCVPAPLELRAGEIFAGFPESRRGLATCVAQPSNTRAIDHRSGTAELAEHAENILFSAGSAISAVSSVVSSRPRSAPRRRSGPPCPPASRVSTSGGEKRIAFFPAPSTSSPRLNAAVTTRVALVGGALLRLPIAHELDADHQPAAAHVADERVLVRRAPAARPSGARRRPRRSPSAAPSAA